MEYLLFCAVNYEATSLHHLPTFLSLFSWSFQDGSPLILGIYDYLFKGNNKLYELELQQITQILIQGLGLLMVPVIAAKIPGVIGNENYSSWHSKNAW